MLDESDFIARYDKTNSLAVIEAQPEQLLHKYVDLKGLKAAKITNIVLAAMGGSALAAEFIKSWVSDRLELPFEIVRDYELPAYVDSGSLVVCYSYSGTTEETIASLNEAIERSAQVVVMASGGPLLNTAKRNNLPHCALPDGFQGRYAVLNGVRAWAQLLDSLGLVPGIVAELEGASKWVQDETLSWVHDSPTDANVAKQLASALLGHSIVVYGGPTLASIAMKWKVDFNENSKNIAFWNWLPEMNHNEFSGWANPKDHGMKVIELTSDLDNPQVAKRFAATNSLLSSRFAPITIDVEGTTKCEQMVWAFMLGSYVSAYLGILNQVDIGTLPAVDKLKQRLT
jgi:glucose/mannose-6-phosphate isomerase